MEFEILQNKDGHVSGRDLIIRMILEDQKIPYKVTIDRHRYMLNSRGHRNPEMLGSLISTPDGDLLYNYFELVEWLSENGMMQCIY